MTFCLKFPQRGWMAAQSIARKYVGRSIIRVGQCLLEE